MLVDCAGVMPVRHQVTSDGLEVQFSVNHLGHFALTGLLIGGIPARPGARVVAVSGTFHRAGSIDFDDVHGRGQPGRRL